MPSCSHSFSPARPCLKFTNHLVARDQEAYDIRAFDLNKDGALDLLIAGRGSKNVAWYQNPNRPKLT